MTDEERRVTLRLPEDVHAEIAEIAKAEDRSLNAQIVHFLRRQVAEWRARRQ